jgi:molecular chaperone DnaK
MGIVIGIDFGTTNSLCAFMDGDRPSIIPNARGARSTPSVVAVSPRGEILVGESARNQALINPGNTIAAPKRHLASGSLLAMGGRNWRPEEIAGLILQSLRADAERHLSREVREAVITAPAHFSDRERRALMEAGRLAGLEVRQVVNEPTAAALARAHSLGGAAEAAPLPLAGRKGRSVPPAARGRRGKVPVGPAAPEGQNDESVILVYDFGGGTFDVTVLRQEGRDCRVLSSRGDGRLGGGDIDRELYRRAARAFLEEEGLEVDTDRLMVQALMDQAERAKIELSERQEADLCLPFAVVGSGNAARVVHPRHTVDRPSFEALILPFVERSLELTDRALADASLGKEDVDVLVLSGGSSRMPLVRRLLEERYGLKPSGGINPEEVVALGAAVSASLSAGSSRLSFHDVVSRTYGVEIDGGSFVPLIRKNSPVPATKSRLFTTVEDRQDSVEIHVLQGESRKCGENLSLGRFLLSGIRTARAGQPRIKVDFSIDESDILHVSAVDLDSGAVQAISIADLGRGAAAESPAELVAKASLLSGRIGELRSGLALEAGLEAELDEASKRAGEADVAMSEGELRLLKAELEGLVGELLARRGEEVGV